MPPTAADGVALAAAAPLFPAVAQLLKNVDAEGTEADAAVREGLDAALGAIERYLVASPPGSFLSGEAPGLADCNVATKLFLVDVAAKHFKGYVLDAAALPR